MAIKTNEYAQAYALVLEKSMAGGSPYEKAMGLIEEQFNKYALSNDERFNASLQTLSSLVQNVTATSQQIALELVMQSEKLELENKNLQIELQIKAKQLEVLGREIELKEADSRADNALKAKQLEVLEAEIPIKNKQLALADKEIALAEKKLLLADKEAEFNAKRAELIAAQADSERARKLAIERETKSYDDRLRIQEATTLKDMVFGYSVGGLTPPVDMTTKAYNAIDAITP